MGELWSFNASIIGLIISVLGLLTVGVKLVSYADAFADRFKLGEALVGGLFLGAITSLSGSIVSGLSAFNGYEALAINNCLGGIAAQTTFLIVADLAYKNVNLEHAAASLPNLVSTSLLIILLSLCLVGQTVNVPDWLYVHPVSPIIVLIYIIGLGWLRETYKRPLWIPKKTKETREDIPDEHLPDSNVSLILKFSLASLIVGTLGYVVTKSAETLIAGIGMSESLTGGFITAVITSLPELVVSVTAVRKGALTLAVANILGGNAFDVLMIVIADILSIRGPIYNFFGVEENFFLGVIILMTAIIAAGLARREKRGWGAIGFEGVAILSIYIFSFTLLVSGHLKR